ncbi:MAG: endonuclease MutS2 [Bacilli bacterium]
MNKYYNLLELHKIVAILQDLVVIEQNKTFLSQIVLNNDLSIIQRMLDEVDEATIIIQRMGRFPLYFNQDIAFILDLIHKGGSIVELDLAEIGKFLDTTKANILFLENMQVHNIICQLFEDYIKQLFYPKELNLRIKEIVNPYGEILDSASETLRIIRKSIRDCERNIQNKLQELLAKNSQKLSQATISMRNDRYVLPVKADSKGAIPGVIHDQSASKETVYIEPIAVMEINNRLNSLKEDEKNEIARIIRTIAFEIDNFYEELKNNFLIFVNLDLIFAKGQYAININAKKPRINNQGFVDLLNCRHPLLNVEKVIPNNISIGKNYQGIIITGPNTGGKTVVLKTVGLLSLMVKLGMLIPCDENSDIMIFDNIFADIGDEQSISQNLSTFSSHVRNVIDIINQVTNHSLVLLDELGSGTDPVEGSSLAIAIFDYLIAKNCLVIATSHYSELKIHAYDSDNIINASVEFDIQTLKPTYKLLLGIPGQSNALNISRHLGLPEPILKQSERYVGEKDTDLNKIIEKLTKQTAELDKKLTIIEDKNQLLMVKIKDADLLKQSLYDEKNRLLKNAEEEARKIIAKTTKKMEIILEELEQMKLKEVKLHEIAEIKHQIKEAKEEAKIKLDIIPNDRELTVNQQVFVESYSCYGTVIKKKQNNKYDVQIGNAQVTVDKQFLRLTDQIKNEQIIKTSTPIGVKKNVPLSLDLRGLRYEEAKDILNKYLDDAAYAGLKQVSIIHGFGTGVLRELVINFLKTSPLVDNYRFGGAGEGGQGATIVNLK